MKKFFTADWHLGSEYVRSVGHRPFKDVVRMNNWIIKQCNEKAKHCDLVYHVGDFLNQGMDRNHQCLNLKFNDYIQQINSQMIFLKGNHDESNGVKTICDLMYTNVGSYNVTVGHFPSNCEIKPKSYDNIGRNHIHICGHVHDSWKYYFDVKTNILNINIGVDSWKYRIVSEVELFNYIDSLLNSKNLFIKLNKNFFREQHNV